MDRLTYFEHGKNRLIFEGTEYSNSVVDRLAAYEDTGLTPEQVKAQQWISVKDRLPEKTGSYLVFYHEWSGGAFLPTYDDCTIRVMRFLDSRKWRYPVCVDKRCEADTNRAVTHWMPLPEPPAEAALKEQEAQK